MLSCKEHLTEFKEIWVLVPALLPNSSVILDNSFGISVLPVFSSLKISQYIPYITHRVVAGSGQIR